MRALFRIRPTTLRPSSSCLLQRPLPQNVLLQRRSFSSLQFMLSTSRDQNTNSPDLKDTSTDETSLVLTDIAKLTDESAAITNTDGPQLLAVPLHDTFPASLGLMTVQGYVEFIKRDTNLPYSKRRRIKSSDGFTRIPSLSICGRLHKYGLRADIAEQDISEYYSDALDKKTLRCRIQLEKDLTGTLTLRYLGADYKMKKHVLQFDAARLMIDGHSSSEVKISRPGDYMLIDQGDLYITKWNMPFKTVF